MAQLVKPLTPFQIGRKRLFLAFGQESLQGALKKVKSDPNVKHIVHKDVSPKNPEPNTIYEIPYMSLSWDAERNTFAPIKPAVIVERYDGSGNKV